MAQIRFFEPGFRIPNEPNDPLTLPVLVTLNRSELVLRESADPQSLVYVYRAAGDAPFGGSAAAGYTGEIASLTVYRGVVEAAARVYEVTDFRAELALLFDPNSDPFALDDAVFGGDDVIVSEDGEISSGALDITTRQGDADVIEGDPARTDILSIDELEDEVLTGEDGGLTLLAERASGATIARLRDVDAVRFGDGTTRTVAELADRPPDADDDILDAGDAVTAGESTLIAAAELTGNDAGFRLPGPGGAVLSLLSVDDGATTGTAVLENGSVRYTASGAAFEALGAGDTLTDSFRYTVVDAAGRTDTATVTLTVTGVDDPAVIDPASDLAASVSELADGDPGEGTEILSDGGDILFSDADVANAAALGTATARLVSGSPAGTLIAGPAEDRAGGSIRLPWSFEISDAALEALPNGPARDLVYEITVPDANGATVLTQEVTVTLDLVNDAPLARPDPGIQTAADASVTIDVLANDTDADGGADGADTLTVASVEGSAIAPGGRVTLASGATVTLTGGRLVYDPNGAFDDLGGGQTRNDSFTYTASDGLDASAPTRVTVTVGGDNSPVVIDDAASVLTGAFDEDADPERAEGAVLFDDADDGDTHTAALSNAAAGFALGAVTAPDGGLPGRVPWSFTPDPATLDALFEGETRTFTATVTVDDGEGAQDSADLSVTVTGVNDAPAVLNDSATTFEGATTTISVLANDSDIDGGAGGAPGLDIARVAGQAVSNGSAVTLASGATVRVAGDTLVYDPNGAFASLGPGQTDTDSFTYRATDGLDESAAATVTVTITGDPEPVLTVADASVIEGDPGDAVELVFRASLSFAAPDPVSFTASTAPSGANPATDSDDYIGLAGVPVTIPAGQSFVDIAVTLRPDDEIEADETFTLTLGALSGALAGDLTATGTILDDDRTGDLLRIANPGLFAATPDPETFVIRVDEDAGRFFNPDFDGQFVLTGFDPLEDLLFFEDLSGLLTEAAILNSTRLDVAEDPFDSEVVYGFDPEPGVTGGIGAIITLTGLDEQEAAFVEVGAPLAGTIPEIAISAPPAGLLDPVRFGAGNDLITVDTGNAYLGEDGDDIYVFDPAQLAGASTAVVDHRGVNALALIQGLRIETFSLATLTNGTNALLLGFGGGDEVFVDNAEDFGYRVGGRLGLTPAPMSFSDFVTTILGVSIPAPGTQISGAPGILIGGALSVADDSVQEGNGGTTPLFFDVTLDGVMGQEVTVDFATVAGGTATPGVDYIDTQLPIQVTIPAGSLSATVSVDVIGDTQFEPDETVAVALSNPVNAQIDIDSAIGTILNDDVLNFTDTLGQDSLTGSGADETLVLLADGAADDFDADGGVDTIDLSGLALGPADQTRVDLVLGEVATPLSAPPGQFDTIANFENVIGSARRDVIVGSAGSNVIESGDAGSDFIFDPVSAPLVGGIGALLVSGDAITDGGGGDEIIAGQGSHVVTLSPDGLAEVRISTTNFVQGLATLDFSLAVSGVVADLTALGVPGSFVFTGGGLGDQDGSTVSGFGGLAGSPFDDDLTANNLIFDGGGVDSVTFTADGILVLAADGVAEASLSGNDFSELNFAFASGGVVVDLTAQGTPGLPVITGGGIGNQTGGEVSGFLDIVGTPFADDLTGEGFIQDGPGSDTIAAVGPEARVVLTADGVGEAAIRGSGASPGLILGNATGPVTVDLSAQGGPNPVITGGGFGDQTGTQVTGIVDVFAGFGSPNAVDLTGDIQDNVLEGSSAGDILSGGSGADTLDGLAGPDVLIGGPGPDTFRLSGVISSNSGQGIDSISDFFSPEGDGIDMPSQINTSLVSFAPNVALPGTGATIGNFFGNAPGGDVTGGISVFDDGVTTRIFADFDGNGDYIPTIDIVLELTGTISGTGLLDTDFF